jgi:hypothetical protein
MYGCVRSIPVSRTAIVMPLPSKPGSATPGRRPLPAANADALTAEPGSAAG